MNETLLFFQRCRDARVSSGSLLVPASQVAECYQEDQAQLSLPASIRDVFGARSHRTTGKGIAEANALGVGVTVFFLSPSLASFKSTQCMSDGQPPGAKPTPSPTLLWTHREWSRTRGFGFACLWCIIILLQGVQQWLITQVGRCIMKWAGHCSLQMQHFSGPAGRT